MQVLWVADPTDGPPDVDPARLVSSRLASQRLRIGIPARELARAGIRQRVSSLSEQAPDDLDADVAVFSKILPRSAAHVERHIEFAQTLSARGVKVAVDVCDNHFGEAAFPYLQRLIAISDGVIANSSAMADIVAAHTERDAVIIPDPVEMARQVPRFEPQVRRGLLRGLQGRVKLLWFGGAPQNYAYLRNWLPRLAAMGGKSLQLELHVVAAPLAEIEADLTRHQGTDNLFMRFTAWSPAVLAAALADCDLVIIPGDPADPLKTGVSANRLAESIQAGRFAVASGMPSYWEFREGAWIGDDLLAGLQWALANQREAQKRIAYGQTLIDKHYLPSVVGAAWMAVFTGLKQKGT